MKAARIGGYNAAPAVGEAPTPETGPGEVLVRVAAAALNPLDNKLRSGAMHGFFPLAFPYTVGTDLAGTVERVGPGAAGWRPGDRVDARTDPASGGAVAEFAAVPAACLVAVPASMTLATAAGVPTAAGTAWQALFEAGRLRSGQTVLVHAAAGGVGSFAIQFARQAGARVVATASGDGVAVARRLGADQVVDYRSRDFAGAVSDVDLVLDTVGGDTQQRSFGVLRVGGALVSTVQPPDRALAEAHRVTATFVAHQSDAARLAGLVDRVAGGTEVLVDRAVPMDGFNDAFAFQGSGRARGKIIVTVP